MSCYDYKCINCGVEEQRIGGLDDNIALCIECGNSILRLNEDIFLPYFNQTVDSVDV